MADEVNISTFEHLAVVQTGDKNTIKAVADVIHQIILQTLKNENNLSYDIPLTSYGISSLAYIIIMSKINEAFKVNLLFEDVPVESTINSLATLVLSGNKE